MMKRATRRALEKWIAPGILGGVVGFIVGIMSEGPDDTLLEPTLGQVQVLTAGGVLLLALALYDMWRSDELERRLYHVAATTAFMGTGLVTLVYGLMQRMGWPELNWGLVFMVMIGFYCAGWWGAWLRYR
jgi:hypothetical protein